MSLCLNDCFGPGQRKTVNWGGGRGGAMRIFVVLIEHKHNQFLKKLHNDD